MPSLIVRKIFYVIVSETGPSMEASMPAPGVTVMVPAARVAATFGCY
jgi:hypothetical protein